MTALGYASGTALRAALESRLSERHAAGGIPLDRLRKEAALQRLLARIAATAAEGTWCLKGGMAMIARVGERARATADADATWRADRAQLQDMLDDAAALDLGDYFEFLVGIPRRMQAEGDGGGLRFPVHCRLGGRLFETLRLDVNLVPDDPRPIQSVRMRNLLDFAGVPEVVVPAIHAEQQLAEKLHAYSRSYGTQENSRAKDLYDMLVIAQVLPLPPAEVLCEACRVTFGMRATDWPVDLAPPADGWAGAWAGFVRDYAIAWVSLDQAYEALRTFWVPLIAGLPSGATWHADEWQWR